MKVLYISYDGMLEPLGQSQVLAYQERLAANASLHLLSFEKPEDWENEILRAGVAQRIKAAGIHWHPPLPQAAIGTGDGLRHPGRHCDWLVAHRPAWGRHRACPRLCPGSYCIGSQATYRGAVHFRHARLLG